MNTNEAWSELAAAQLDSYFMLGIGQGQRLLAREFSPLSREEAYNTEWDSDEIIAGVLPFDEGAEPIFLRVHQYEKLRSQASQVSCVPLTLAPALERDDYQKCIDGIIDQIREGRFYQLNYLRYFGVDTNPDHLIRLSARRNAEYGANVKIGELCLASLSPERFVEGCFKEGAWHLSAYPVKGTCAASVNPDQDKALLAELRSCPKNRAELNMIIDLMRNDFAKVCTPGSVRADLEPRVISPSYLHHLEGRVCGTLADGTKLGGFFTALCPAGSVSGAPKEEVLLAIHEWEGRRRGFLMGNAFWFDGRLGRFYSNVLIRTIVGQGKSFEFAAGGGIVVKSNADDEWSETIKKCGVLEV